MDSLEAGPELVQVIGALAAEESLGTSRAVRWTFGEAGRCWRGDARGV